MDSEERLLLQADAIVRRHEEAATSRGDRFNVFEILDRATDEVRGHSAVLACLLDPKGVHGQGSAFLDLFIGALREALVQGAPGSGDHLSLARFDEAMAGEAAWTVNRELALPSTDAGGEASLGRLDLLIQRSGTAIIIENKIYAADQDRQLQRYHDYAVAKGWPHVYLIYLTLKGSEPSVCSLGSLDRGRVLCLDYGGFILGWLENCIRAVALLPHIRETLYQYHRLLQRLTQSAGNREMTMEIAGLIARDAGMLAAAINVERSLPEAKAQLHLAFWRALEAALRSRLGDDDGRLTATYSESKVQSFGTPAVIRGRERYFGLTVRLSEGCADPALGLAVLVGTDFYYAIYTLHDGEPVPTADESLRDQICPSLSGAEWERGKNSGSIAWRYPGSQWRLNFQGFDGSCVLLADAERMREHADGMADEVLHLWQELRAHCR